MAENPNPWIRVHSDEDENKSDEEFLVRNRIRLLIETMLRAPSQVTYPESNLAWWELQNPKWEALINEAASDIAKEYETGGTS